MTLASSFFFVGDFLLPLYLKATFVLQPMLTKSMSFTLLPRADDAKNRAWSYVHTAAVWLFPAVVYCSVMGVFVLLMRALTRMHATQYLDDIGADMPVARPLDDLLLPKRSLDFDSIFDSTDAVVADNLTSFPLYIALAWIFWEADRPVWCSLGGTLSLLFSGKAIATHLTILPEVRGPEYCAWVLDRWKERPADGIFVFCGDMMWSGHTMMMACGTILLITMMYRYQYKYRLLQISWVRRTLIFALLLTNVATLCLLVHTKMHYSVDIFIALLMTTLLFSNDQLQRWIRAAFLVPDALDEPAAMPSMRPLRMPTEK